MGLPPYFPDDHQERLLKAGLLKDENAISAWRKWKDENSIDHIDSGCFRLLPLVYRNLSRRGANDTVLPKLKGIHRQYWLKNQLLLHVAMRLFTALHDAGVERILVLKGLALVWTVYADPGLRPMDDYDVVIDQDQLGQAIEVIKNNGWEQTFPVCEANVKHQAKVVFTHPNHLEIDLHPFLIAPQFMQTFWNTAETHLVNGISIMVLCPSDQLLHTFVHGAEWREIAPIRWVADACMIIDNQHGHLDWNRFLRLAEEIHFIRPLQDMIPYLRYTFSAPIPDDVLRTLRGTKVSHYGRVYYQNRQFHDWRKMTPMLKILKHLSLFFPGRSQGSLIKRLLIYLDWLKAKWGIGSSWQVPLWVCFKTLRFAIVFTLPKRD